MKIEIIKFGAPKTQEIQTLFEIYFKRSLPFCPMKFECLKEKSLEATWKKLCERKVFKILLDETGAELSSIQLSKKISHWQSDPQIKEAVILIGGPYGFEKEKIKQAAYLWSLSKMTLPSDLAWLVCMEQLYRAFTIIKNMDYHHV